MRRLIYTTLAIYAKSLSTEAYIPYRFVDSVTENASIPMSECDDFDSGDEMERYAVRDVQTMTEKLRKRQLSRRIHFSLDRYC